YDIVLTNPPFGGKEGAHIQNNFATKGNATELLFLQHILKKLKHTPDARAAVVVPEGTLFRGGAFAEVKQILLDDFHLFAVVSLPPGAFAPYSDVKTALLFFRRVEGALERNPAARAETWYYELPLPEGLKKFSKGNPIADEHFAEARAMWQHWRAWRDGKGERPFAEAETLREQWRAYWESEAPKSQNLSPSKGIENPKSANRPGPPYTTWIERLDALRARDYDLSARNPNQDARVTLPHPAEITARLLERQREFQSILEHVHQMVSDGEVG
ncbi:MAG: N-6 DNA methylase, partial [Anaerolineae bacterium]|nr:N-6 DNA methylase [Anaerolineae bacterium]